MTKSLLLAVIGPMSTANTVLENISSVVPLDK